MKKLLLLLISAWSLQSFSQTGLNVVFKQAESAEIVVALDNLEKIVFQGDKMIYYLNNGTDCSIDLDSFLGFLVTSPTATEKIESESGDICFTDGSLTVTGYMNETIKIYSLSCLVKEMTVESETQSFDLSDLPRGVYIAVIGTNVIELLK